MILHDELHHFHHGGHGHMGRLPSMPEEGGDDGDDLRLTTVSKANLSSSLMELKAVGIATFLMTVGAVTVMWSVKSALGVNDAQEFGKRIIYRPAATDEDYLDAYEVAPFEAEGWTWVEAEKRLMMRGFNSSPCSSPFSAVGICPCLLVHFEKDYQSSRRTLARYTTKAQVRYTANAKESPSAL
ncbi:uncharacterized protein LACBIDRAFT_328316 [Laccaria bicolor S238N-H82]|uniref:Predicted protein n=1 Tax=Laccaria bicolor (strain S238N-H82 / ATCC MYA-4686) TaxID=486041 RepID=B0DEI4_LACBS|nr:uncharacterized protein LACBIDRAFT_328316 [Laccaria bicolor S238N-H82]EDR06942.1 predicted protein [Laccaria bicolor S238N-H82]|eukprot:XP_001882315.1 predicted protein [Laccaria bicolor S238N-H82]